jgi:negative regulator of sigma-B (phosphoserine phosphatase)
MTCLEWGWASAALGAGEVSGDRHVVAILPHGALVAVIDGLGHGPEASEVAELAAAILLADPTQPIKELIERCHEGLRGTRGAVMSVATLDTRASSMDWFGVGNVEGLLFHTDAAGRRSHQTIRARGGVLGYRLPPTVVATVPISPRDVVVLASDGIRSEFSGQIALDWPPQAIADWLLQRYGLASDDALALVIRYLGGEP